MAREDQQNKSLAAQAAWPLLLLTAALQLYIGLSYVAYAFMGVPSSSSGLVRWTAGVAGAFQIAAAIVAFVLATRRDLRAATLAVAASLVLGWLATVPAAIEQGLDFYGDDRVSPIIFVITPLIAIVAAMLAWRNPHPIAAALVASVITVFGILVVIAFAMIIAVHGF